MGKYTINELEEIAKKHNIKSVEIVKYKNNRRILHTDFIKSLDYIDILRENYLIDSIKRIEKEYKKTLLNKDNEINVDYEIMDAEEYNNTLYANCGEYAEEGDDFLPTMIIILEDL